jgi:hypothetical protein
MLATLLKDCYPTLTLDQRLHYYRKNPQQVVVAIVEQLDKDPQKYLAEYGYITHKKPVLIEKQFHDFVARWRGKLGHDRAVMRHGHTGDDRWDFLSDPVLETFATTDQRLKAGAQRIAEEGLPPFSPAEAAPYDGAQEAWVERCRARSASVEQVKNQR